MAQPQLPHAPVVVVADDEHALAPIIQIDAEPQPSTPPHQVIPAPQSPPNIKIEHAKAKAKARDNNA